MLKMGAYLSPVHLHLSSIYGVRKLTFKYKGKLLDSKE